MSLTSLHPDILRQILSFLVHSTHNRYVDGIYHRVTRISYKVFKHLSRFRLVCRLFNSFDIINPIVWEFYTTRYCSNMGSHDDTHKSSCRHRTDAGWELCELDECNRPRHYTLPHPYKDKPRSYDRDVLALPLVRLCKKRQRLWYAYETWTNAHDTPKGSYKTRILGFQRVVKRLGIQLREQGLTKHRMRQGFATRKRYRVWLMIARLEYWGALTKLSELAKINGYRSGSHVIYGCE